MNDGIFFYFAAWSGWIFYTFISDKNNSRTKSAIFILMMILLSGFETVNGNISAGWASAGLLVFSLYGFLKLSFRDVLRLMMASITVMALLAALHIFFLYDPAVLIMPQYFLAGLFAVVMAVTWGRTYHEVLLVLATGLLFGDFLIQLSFLPLKGYLELGSKEFLDLAGFSMIAVFFFQMAASFVKSLNGLHLVRRITFRR
ncbi:hypothetical protein ACFFJY_09520 [Fictibacillus aquaticus]|uniref:Uncharacterized protein n=1 Tax=Fictibacillus aquaticus TaxID=2021314 RepID=A0A235FAY6_9BACL|nr:hypothetical protein [Fictibacillus aquaticus]OYD58510.1 hypothetical protein CGZ90_01005 [Fictibacillus aquaticus]